MTDGVNSRILTAYGKHPLSAVLTSWLSAHDVTASLETVTRPSGANAALWLAPKKGFRDAVLFLHGMGNDHLYANFDLFTAFVEHGIAVLSVDLDGHGSLSQSTLDASHLPGLAGHGWECLKELAPSARHHLVGYSLGAALSLQATQWLTPTSLSLVAYPLARTQTWIFLAKEALSLAHPMFFTAMTRQGPRAVWPALGSIGRNRYPVRMTNAANSWAYVQEVDRFLSSVDPFALAPQLVPPTLWLSGVHDALSPPRNLDELAQKTPRGRSVKLGGAGHLTILFHRELGPTLAAHILS